MKASDFIISEAFDSNVQGKLVRATNDLFTTRATIGDRDIVFNASMYARGNIDPALPSSEVWEIEFTERTPGNITYGKSGSGNEMQVFSFVIESIKALVARYNPQELEFHSHKADGNRTALYKRMLSRIKIPGYSADNIVSGNTSDIFRIVRDK
jgi:hypothetical protein